MKFAAKLFLLYEKSVQHKKACEAGTKENKTKGFFKEEKIMVVVLKPDTKEEQIENLKETGEIKVNGVPWTAVSADGSVIPEGSLVRIERLEGAKVYVSPVKASAASNS